MAARSVAGEPGDGISRGFGAGRRFFRPAGLAARTGFRVANCFFVAAASIRPTARKSSNVTCPHPPVCPSTTRRNTRRPISSGLRHVERRKVSSRRPRAWATSLPSGVHRATYVSACLPPPIRKLISAPASTNTGDSTTPVMRSLPRPLRSSSVVRKYSPCLL